MVERAEGGHFHSIDANILQHALPELIEPLASFIDLGSADGCTYPFELT